MRNTRSERGNWYHRDLESYLRQTEDEPDQAHRVLRRKLALVLREEVTPASGRSCGCITART